MIMPQRLSMPPVRISTGNLLNGMLSGAGYPSNVTIQNNTVLKLGANSGMDTPRSMSGTLTIESGSALSMNITEKRNDGKFDRRWGIANDGDLYLSGRSGGDLNIGGDRLYGNIQRANGRMVTFTGTQPEPVRRIRVHRCDDQRKGGSTLTLNDNHRQRCAGFDRRFHCHRRRYIDCQFHRSVNYTSGYVKGNLRE